MMKVLLLKKDITNEVVLQAGLLQVKQLLNSINFPIEFNQQVTTTNFISVPFIGTSPEVKSGYQLHPQQILDEEKKYGDHDIDCLIFDPTKYNPQPTNPIDNGEAIQIPSNWFGNAPEVFAQFFLHELAHYCFWKYGGRDITHEFYTSAFSQKSPTDYYLFLLKSFVPKLNVNPTPVTTYKYFKASEVVGLKPKLVEMLDKAREIAGIPFAITSGYRTLSKNDEVGGVEDSSHTIGEAVDLRARNSNEHFLITKALMDVGFTRISKKYPLHIHVDISSDKVQNVLF